MSGSFLTDDLSTVFDTVDFSVVGTYTPDGGSATSINGIFDDEDLEVDVGEGSLILQRSAKFTCASGDVIGIAEGDALTVASVDYIITYFKDDGTGVTETYLEVV